VRNENAFTQPPFLSKTLLTFKKKTGRKTKREKRREIVVQTIEKSGGTISTEMARLDRPTRITNKPRASKAQVRLHFLCGRMVTCASM
jgi:hypothetical protein